MQDITIFETAAYTRASKDDPDSSTIDNQLALIKEYALSMPDIHIISEQSDNGYSGVDFLRPGFMEMMKDIETGKINCVIVKDAYIKLRINSGGKQHAGKQCYDRLCAGHRQVFDPRRAGYTHGGIYEGLPPVMPLVSFA